MTSTENQLIPHSKVWFIPNHYSFESGCGIGYRILENGSLNHLEFEVVAFFENGTNDNEFLLFEKVSLETHENWKRSRNLIGESLTIKVHIGENDITFVADMSIPHYDGAKTKANRRTRIPKNQLRGLLRIKD